MHWAYDVRASLRTDMQFLHAATVPCTVFNPLDSKGNYSGTSNNTKLLHRPLMGGLLHLVERGGASAGCGPAQSPPRSTKCNSPPVNSQCIPITVLLYDGPLLCGFNAAIKGLNNSELSHCNIGFVSV